MNNKLFFGAAALLIFSFSCNRYGKDLYDEYNWDEGYDTTSDYYDNYDYSDNDYNTDEEVAVYQPSYTISCDLISTKLAVNFDWKKCYMNGTEWVSLKPHWYPTDTLTMDAKGMNIVSLSVQTPQGDLPLTYIYDSTLLRIWLDKTYTRTDTFHLKIEYVFMIYDCALAESIST